MTNYITLILLIALFSCANSTSDKEDNAPTVKAEIGTIELEYNELNYVLNLNDYVLDKDGDPFTYEILIHSNKELLTLEIIEGTCKISVVSNKGGITFIQIRATTNGKSVDIAGEIIVNERPFSSYYEEAVTLFKNEKYNESMEVFKPLFHSENPYRLRAYTAVGYCYISLEMYENAYNTFQTGNLIKEDVSLLAGLALLEYTFKQDYNEVIGYANSVLSRDTNFEYELDTSINHKDIRLVLAISLFHLGHTEAALNHAKQLDSDLKLELDDPEIRTKLAAELNRLSLELILP